MNNIVFIPGSPALVEELAAADDASQQLLVASRGVIADALAEKPRPIHIVSSRDKRWYTAHEGSFKAWGAGHVNVGQGHYLPELIARYVIDGKAEVTQCRDEIRNLDPEALTVVVLDGTAGLTARAPLALVDGATLAHQWCEQVLRGEEGDMPLLADAGVIEPDLWLQIAQLAPKRATLIASDSALGVGRYVATWEVE